MSLFIPESLADIGEKLALGQRLDDAEALEHRGLQHLGQRAQQSCVRVRHRRTPHRHF